ncbi:unnamed protein product [Soboliphyme baturini]|uniref:DNA excision repair protein ERCC-1 n=1 Tax=Soboliphyme baturini TaxID=241478 RepID=A0A183IJH2_9BILA|nr:unnamed protein product [Soboliphyme baturini]
MNSEEPMEQSSTAKAVHSFTKQKSFNDSRPGISSVATAGQVTVVVNSRQKGNPVLRYVRNVAWEYGETPADYVMGKSCCGLFLSLKFHKLHPSYIHERMKEVGRKYAVQMLLVQVDLKEPQHILRELNSVCFLASWTLILAWSPEEVAEYIEAYKIYETKSSDFLVKKVEYADGRARLVDLLTSIKSISNSDAQAMITTFGSLKNIAQASVEELALCPGMGLKKAKKLYEAMNREFCAQRDDVTGDGDPAPVDMFADDAQE